MRTDASSQLIKSVQCAVHCRAAGTGCYQAQVHPCYPWNRQAGTAICCLDPTESTGLTIATAITAWISLSNNGLLQQAGDILQYWCDQISYIAQSCHQGSTSRWVSHSNELVLHLFILTQVMHPSISLLERRLQQAWQCNSSLLD